MKNIVIITKNYYPYNSAVGICLGNIAEIMSIDNNVTIICEKSRLNEANKEIMNGQRIIRVISKSTNRRMRLAHFIESSNAIVHLISKSLLLFYRCYEYGLFLFSKYSIQKSLISEYFSILTSLNEQIDIIIPSCMPIETIIASVQYNETNSKTEVVPFLFDKFAENGTLHRTKWNKKLKMNSNIDLEKRVFDKCSRILFTPSWKNHIIKNLSSLETKFRPVEHPLIKKIVYSDLVKFNQNKINIVYTGTLMLNSRNPKPMITLFDVILPKQPQLQLHFYAMGNAKKIIKEFEKRNKDNVVFHGQVSTETAHSAMVNSTFLLSIGNTDITQTPSKIFEYISCCKPIIHIAVFSDDPVIDILKLYPLACCICLETESFEDQIVKLEKFLNQDQKIIKFEDLDKPYFNAKPEYSVMQIMG